MHSGPRGRAHTGRTGAPDPGPEATWHPPPPADTSAGTRGLPEAAALPPPLGQPGRQRRGRGRGPERKAGPAGPSVVGGLRPGTGRPRRERKGARGREGEGAATLPVGGRAASGGGETSGDLRAEGPPRPGARGGGAHRGHTPDGPPPNPRGGRRPDDSVHAPGLRKKPGRAPGPGSGFLSTWTCHGRAAGVQSTSFLNCLPSRARTKTCPALEAASRPVPSAFPLRRAPRAKLSRLPLRHHRSLFYL